MDADWAFANVLVSTAAQSCRAIGRMGRSDHAFIDYWPAPRDSKQLRLAVKDNIDMKGVVTSAGSEYVAQDTIRRRHATRTAWLSRGSETCGSSEKQISVNLRWLLPA